MALPKKKTAAPIPKAAPKSADQSLFDDFLPHLIARLAYQLNADLIEKLRREGINVTRWLMRMEKENYVRRVLRREDARCVEVYLTDKGRALFNSLNIVVRRREQRLLEGFSPAQTAAAFAMIRRLSRNMRGRP